MVQKKDAGGKTIYALSLGDSSLHFRKKALNKIDNHVHMIL